MTAGSLVRGGITVAATGFRRAGAKLDAVLTA